MIRQELEWRAAAAIRSELARRQYDRENARLADLSPAHFAWWLSNGAYQRQPHLDLISEECALALETGVRVIICAPPGHGKSTTISQWSPAWFIRKHPEKLIGLAGHTEGFAATWGEKVRNILVEHRRRCGVEIRGGVKASASDWRTTKGGGMICVGIMGGIMGRRLHGLIVDDPVKNSQEATSPTYQERLKEIHESTLATRLEPQAGVIVTMQRWPGHDYIQWLIDRHKEGRERWRIVLLPALYDEDAARHGPDPLDRRVGEALWPSKWDAQFLLDKRLSLEDQALWHSQWQQRPEGKTSKDLAYFNFSVDHSIAECVYDPKLPICWALDFNVDPMCSVIAQVQKEFTPASFSALHAKSTEESLKKTIRILDEIYLENSSTQSLCAEFIKRIEPLMKFGQQIEVIVYGDASGYSRKTSGPVDYRVIDEAFRADGRIKFSIRAGKKNPGQRDRVTTVNNAFLNAVGERRLFIAEHCVEVRRDLLYMRWHRDVKGNPTNDLDDSNSRRGHITDAVGYLAWGELKMDAQSGFQAERVF